MAVTCLDPFGRENADERMGRAPTEPGGGTQVVPGGDAAQPKRPFT